MAALKEWLGSMAGKLFTCDDAPGGPHRAVRARSDNGVILITLATPDGEKEVRLDSCLIYHEPVKAK